MLSPQMMSLLAAYTASEVKQGTGQLYRSQEHLGGLSLPHQPFGFALSETLVDWLLPLY